MTVNVDLYNTTDDFRRVNKNIGTKLESLTIHTSDDCSIINPDLLVNLQSTVENLNRLRFNYAIISTFANRRYFVTPEYSTATRMILHCYLDCYSSFNLSNVEGFITRTGNASGRMKDDSVPVIYGDMLVQPYPFPYSPYKWSVTNPENNNKQNIYILRTR